MVTFNSFQHPFNPTAPAPEVNGLLPDTPGGERGLLPVALTGDDLRVWFTIPPLSDPTAGEERYELFVNDETDAIATRYWSTPIEDSDRYLELPADWMRNNDGQHRIYYKTTIYNDAENYSLDLVMTLDTKAPVLAADSQLIFPSEVLLPNKLTAHYLELNNDEVKADLPVYTSPRPWDRITWYWGTTPGTQDEGGVIELDDKNYSAPVVVTIAGDLIRDRDDGWRYVWYQVQDRAGNLSQRSDPVELDVAATPIPRVLPWPSVEKAAGEGEQQTLDPLQALNGAIIQVPLEAVIYPEEKAWVQWGEPGSLGATRVEQPISSGQRRYQVDMKYVAAHIGRTLSVAYGVIDEMEEQHDSIQRKLQVLALPINRLKPVNCNGLSGGSLSYSAVAPEGARLTLDKWPLMTTDHWVMITMTGVNSSGQDSSFNAVNKRAVTEQETSIGIGYGTDVRLPKAFLNTLRRNAPLTGKVYVSFDGGQTWPPLSAPNFPLLQLTLVN